jgi:hypothetical protein
MDGHKENMKNGGSKMKEAILAFVASYLACWLTLQADGDIYVISQSGAWRAAVTDSPQPWQRIATFGADDTVVIVDGEPQPNPPDPPDDSLAGKIQAISAATLRSKDEATAMVSVVRLFQRTDADLSKAKSGMTAAVTVLKSSSLFAGNQFDQWLSQVNALSPGQYTAEFLQAVETGLERAFNLPGGQMVSRADVERITIIELIELIKTIIQLLRDLGILGG